MAHTQKPDFVFRRNGRVHLNRRGSSVQSTAGNRCVRISGSNAGYIMFRGSVKSTGYPLHSPVSPFTSPSVRHRVPSHFNWSLTQNYVFFLSNITFLTLDSLHFSTVMRLILGVLVIERCFKLFDYTSFITVWVTPVILPHFK